MHQLKRVIRRMLAYFLYYTGLLWLYARWRLQRKAIVLMYHRVLRPEDDSFSHEGIVVSPRTFELQMEFLARHFRPLTEAQFRAQLGDSSFASRSCLVTIDDGWQDNIVHAFPVLQKHRVPAIVFVATGYVGTNDTFWQERLMRLLTTACSRGEAASRALKGIGFDPGISTSPKYVRMRAREFVVALKSLDPSVARRAIDVLQTALHDVPACRDLAADTFMTWEDVVALHQSGLVTIGSHAHSHLRLTALGYKGALQELETSHRELARHGITEVTACAYPNGDVNDPVEAAATDAGFTLGFGTRRGLVAHSSEAMHLRRINIHEADSASRPEFLYRILGLP